MVIKKYGTADFFYRLIKKYFNDDINSTAAALAYYMIFSFFPLVLGLSMILGYADIDSASVSKMLSDFMPKDVIQIISRYLFYVSNNKSVNIMAVSLFFTFVFPMRAVNYIMLGVDKAYGSKTKRKLHIRLIMSILFSVIILFTIIASLILLTLGRSIFDLAEKITPLKISADFVDMWVYLRFVIMAAICSVTITALYYIAPSKKIQIKNAVPGAVAAVSLWICVSAAFSFYVEHMGNYSVLFGSIGAIIVLLLWLYMTAVILLIGAEINSVLEEMRIEEIISEEKSDDGLI